MALLAACGGAGSEAVPATSITAARSTAATTDPATEPAPGPDPADPTTTVPGGGELRCQPIDRPDPARVARPELVEASGLAASRRHDGVLWAANDSGRAAGLFAVGVDGTDLGFFALVRDGASVDTADVEDLAIVDDTVYLADIGDNARRRDTVSIIAVTEPEPGTDGTIEWDRTIEVRYPDGPTDAEALLVDPVRGELVILSKDLDAPADPTRLYTVPLPTGPDGDGPGDGGGATVEAAPAGTIDVAALTAGSAGFSINTLLFPGVVTGADLSPAGDLIALRTYGSVWLFPRHPALSVAEALTTTTPCEVGSAAEAQGETVAFLPEAPGAGEPSAGRRVAFVTISEGRNPPVNVRVAEVSP